MLGAEIVKDIKMNKVNGVAVTDKSSQTNNLETEEVEYRQEHDRAFAQYDAAFQERVFHVLLHDREWAQEISEVMDPNMFDEEHLRYLAGTLWQFFRRYKAFPSVGIFVSNIKENLEDMEPTLRSRVVAFLPKIAPTPIPTDAAYIKDKVEGFCRRQNFRDALMRSVDLMKDEKYDAVFTIMKNAVSASTPGSKGHDFHMEREARWEGIERDPIQTGLAPLDKVIGGGLSNGELGVVVAPTGVGKSHWLVNVGAQAVYDGKNVIHYTFELSEHATGRRYDSWFTNIDSNEILTRKDDLMLAYARLENERNLGQLYIKEYPTGTASVVTLKGHLERLRMTGFVPDLIIVDYADIMKAASGTEGERFKQKAVYEELRALSKEMKLPIWTASQSNREGAGSEIITSEQMGESYGKAQVADLIVSLSRKPLEKANGTARMFVAKNRMGSDGFVFGINIDTARSQFEENEELMDLVDAQKQDSQARKNFTSDILRETNQKWNKVRTAFDRINDGE
jgi:replicative DNA helicase